MKCTTCNKNRKDYTVIISQSVTLEGSSLKDARNSIESAMGSGEIIIGDSKLVFKKIKEPKPVKSGFICYDCYLAS